MQIYDITLPLQEGLAPWPGDTPYTFVRNLQIADGASVNLGSLCMSVHTGTHTDAPNHYERSWATVEHLDLQRYIGPAVVADVCGCDPITVADVQALPLADAPRVLFKTGAWDDHARFPDRIPTLHPDVPAYLHTQGVVLIGLDVPSVDDPNSKTLPIHHALGACNIAILESLLLRDIMPGRYELLALPLNLVGADGAPVRAVLRR